MKIQDINKATMALQTKTGELSYYSGFDGCISHEYTFDEYEVRHIKDALKQQINEVIDNIFAFDRELLNAEIVDPEE